MLKLWWRLSGQLRWRRHQLGQKLLKHGGCKCFEELVSDITLLPGQRILPKPHWCQDVAWVAYYIDGLNFSVQHLVNTVTDPESSD